MSQPERSLKNDLLALIGYHRSSKEEDCELMQALMEVRDKFIPEGSYEHKR